MGWVGAVSHEDPGRQEALESEETSCCQTPQPGPPARSARPQPLGRAAHARPRDAPVRLRGSSSFFLRRNNFMTLSCVVWYYSVTQFAVKPVCTLRTAKTFFSSDPEIIVLVSETRLSDSAFAA